MHDYQDATWQGLADRYKPMLLIRMAWVPHGGSKRVAKYCGGLLEGNAVFLQVACGLVRIPTEL